MGTDCPPYTDYKLRFWRSLILSPLVTAVITIMIQCHKKGKRQESSVRGQERLLNQESFTDGWPLCWFGFFVFILSLVLYVSSSLKSLNSAYGYKVQFPLAGSKGWITSWQNFLHEYSTLERDLAVCLSFFLGIIYFSFPTFTEKKGGMPGVRGTEWPGAWRLGSVGVQGRELGACLLTCIHQF